MRIASDIARYYKKETKTKKVMTLIQNVLLATTLAVNLWFNPNLIIFRKTSEMFIFVHVPCAFFGVLNILSCFISLKFKWCYPCENCTVPMSIYPCYTALILICKLAIDVLVLLNSFIVANLVLITTSTTDQVIHYCLFIM